MMKHMLLVGMMVSAFCGAVHAVVLDWDTVDWTAGGTSQTFYDVEGSGIDVTISLSLSYDRQRHRNPYRRWDRYTTQSDFMSDAPDDNTDFGGDRYVEDEESLYIGVDLASDDRDKSYLDVTISFSQSIENLNFSLFDVDSYGYNYWGGYETGIQFRDVIDQIESEYQGTSSSNATVSYDSSRIYEQTNNGDTAYYGNTSLTSVYDQSDNPASTLNFSWNSPVDSISFRYGSGADAVADPGTQAIGLSDISFQSYNAVPEPGTYLTGGLTSLFLLFSFIRKRKKEK